MFIRGVIINIKASEGSLGSNNKLKILLIFDNLEQGKKYI